MEFNISWYQAVSSENILMAALPLAMLSALLVGFSKKWFARILGFGVIGLIAGLTLHSSGQSSVIDLMSLNNRVNDFSRSASMFSMPIRKEVRFLSEKLSKAQSDEAGYVGDLLKSHQALMLSRFDFMTKEETAVYKKFLSHCYSENTVNTVWNEKLPGYPILPHEAQQALAYAEARSEQIKPECLGTTASLSFLK